MRRPTLMTALAALLALCLATTAACSDDSNDSAGEDNPEEATPTTDPPALNQAAVDEVQGLIDEIDDLVTIVDADPTIVDDPDNETIQRFRDLHTEDSPLPGYALESFESLAYYDYAQRPPEGEFYRGGHVLGARATAPDTIDFTLCSILNAELIDADGAVEEAEVTTTLGEATVQRVDGAWRMHDLRYDDDTERRYDNIEDLPEDACEESYVDQHHPAWGADDEDDEGETGE